MASLYTACAAASDGSRSFRMPALGLAVRYPQTWRRYGSADGTLSLMRPEMPFRGPIQPHGQARINVGPSTVAGGSDQAIIHHYITDYEANGILMTPIETLPAGGAVPCDYFTRVTYREDVVPPENRTVRLRDIVYTMIVCSTPAGAVVGIDSLWIDDPNRARTDADLLAIMRSLRRTATAK